jgi:hypothetical protein
MAFIGMAFVYERETAGFEILHLYMWFALT